MTNTPAVCANKGIEHGLAPPWHPQTNGMVERFNGRNSELLQQTRFSSRAGLESTLLNYLKLYKHTFHNGLSVQKRPPRRSRSGRKRSQTYS
ncbi:transposase [Massilia sp. LMS1-1-1.1]